MARSLSALAVCCAALLLNHAAAQRTYDTDILADTFGFDESTPKRVALEDLHQGCPARDCIRSIDDPKYVDADAASHVADNDPVIAIGLNGDHRAYPARIMDRHEIVNDTIGGVPVAITWCPLCGSAVGIRRDIDGRVTEFGVSGLLYNSDLVFYDRESETLWDQIEAKGIVGPRTGESLTLVPLTMTTWSRWREAHPDTRVLSADTGHAIDYSTDPYARYRGSDGIMFPVSGKDDRIHPKTVVYGFDIDGRSVAFTESLLEDGAEHAHAAGGLKLVARMEEDGSVTARDEHGGRYTPTRLFWFAWYTFHPDTGLVR